MYFVPLLLLHINCMYAICLIFQLGVFTLEFETISMHPQAQSVFVCVFECFYLYTYIITCVFSV